MKKCKYLCCLFVLICIQTNFAQPAFRNTQGGETSNSLSAEALHLGRYELYAGIPSMYIGHFILLGNGRYKVAFGSDEENYDESGTYIFHAETNTIEWTAGMFKNNNWSGKIVKQNNGYRIQFNAATYGDSK